MNAGVKNKQGLAAAKELIFDVLRLVLMYLHKAKVITTNVEALVNAYKENSRHSYVCSNLGTPQIKRTYKRI